MAKSYKIIGTKSWANSSMRWTSRRQSFLQRPWWASLSQPYPAGCRILGDEQIAISGLPVAVYDKLAIKRFEFGDIAIDVNSGRLPPEAFIMGVLNFENNVSGYDILESAAPDLFKKVANPSNDDPDKFYVEDIESVNIPLFVIRAPSNADQKILYGELANFSQTGKFTVIKLAWGPLSIVQGQKGPILLGGFYNPILSNTGQEIYE